MYDVLDLLRRAGPGWADLLGTAREGGGRLSRRGVLAGAWGPWPRALLFALAALAVAYSLLVPRGSIHLPYVDGAHGAVLCFALPVAWGLRRGLRPGGGLRSHGEDAPRELFRALGWALVPFALLLALALAWIGLAHASDEGGPLSLLGVAPGQLLSAGEGVLRAAAAIAVVVSTLTFSRRWFGALIGLAVALFVFNLVVEITRLVMLVIFPLGKLTNWIVGAFLAWTLPGWAIALLDQAAHAGFMAGIDLALIGCAWSVGLALCERLVREGEVDFVAELQTFAGGSRDDDPDAGSLRGPASSEGG